MDSKKYNGGNIFLPEKKNLISKDRFFFGNTVLAIFFLSIITSAFTQMQSFALIIHIMVITVFISLYIIGKGKLVKEKYYIFAAIFVNITPFLLYFSRRILPERSVFLLYNQLGLAMATILATQILRNKRVLISILIPVSTGWLLILAYEVWGAAHGKGLYPEEHMYSYTLLMGIVLIGTFLSLLKIKLFENNNDKLFLQDRTLDFLVQSGNLGLFELDFEKDRVRGNVNFYHHMGSDSTREEQSFVKDILPHVNLKDQEKYFDTLLRIKNKLPLEMPLEVKIYDKTTQFRWIRVDGKLNHNPGGTTLFVGLTTDIDDLKRSEEKARAYAASVKASMMTGKISIWQFDIEMNHFITGENSFSSREDLPMDQTEKIIPYDLFLSRVHSDSRDLVDNLFQMVKKGVKDWFNVDYLYHIGKSNTMTWLKDYGVVSSYDEDKRPLMISGYTLNIDNEIRESQKIDRALRASRFVPWSWNVKDMSGELDRNYLDLLGFPQDKYSFSREALFERMIHPLDVPLINDLLQKACYRTEENSDPGKFEVFRMRFSDRERYYWMEAQIMAAFHNEKGEPVQIEGIIRNITREKEQNILLEEQKKENSVAEAKNRFFSTLSHELKTPMNIIQGMTKILNQTELDSQQRETLGKIEESSALLLSIINDLLEFSQLNKQKQTLNIEPFSLGDLLEELRKEFHDAALSKGLIFELNSDSELPPYVMGDKGKIILILRKLIHNGLKFTPRGKVVLSCRQLGQQGDDCCIHFSVRDDGIGIPGEKQSQLFKPFFMVDDRESRGQGGSGLGLAISSHMLELMNSKIDISSAPGEGSIFSFELSLKISHDPNELDGKEITYPGSRVLVVDDNPLNREIALDILKHAGIMAMTASNGQEALALMAMEKPELVFMDIQMPLMDGLTTTRIQRERESKGEHIPIVAMTANTTDADRELSFSAGMDGHLGKPLVLRKIYRVLEYWLADHRVVGNKKDPGKGKMPPLPGVDMKPTLERFAGEYSSLILLIREFINDYKDIDRILHGLILEENQEELHRRIHALKGVSGSLGIVDIYLLSHILTVQYRENSRVDRTDLEHFIDLIKQFCKEMEAFLIRENL